MSGGKRTNEWTDSTTWSPDKGSLTSSQTPVKVWSDPKPVMGTTRDYCRYMEALLAPYLKAITVRGIDLMYGQQGNEIIISSQ